MIMPGRTIQSLLRDDRGAVAVTYALSLTALVAIAGLGFDYARLVTMDSELQNGADQAALAGATQLDGKSGTCARASAAARTLVSNITILANDGAGTAITMANETACDAVGSIRFWQDRGKATAATSEANANFIEVVIDARVADFAFTPIVGALSSGNINAAALAGVGSSICKVPPLMICNPDPGSAFNAAGRIGWGVQVTAKGAAGWGPGDFGFLEVGSGQKADLEKALAFASTSFDCSPIDGSRPQTGNAQGLYRAMNTRFDIYDTSGNPLGNCQTQDCPPASNVLKDLVKPNNNVNGNACKTHSSGWQLPNKPFSPALRNAGTETAMSLRDADAQIDAMGLTRDMCHYTSYGYACRNTTGLTTDRFGNGNWARGDYFNKYHAGRIPGTASTMTRYATYKWELANGHTGTISGSNAGSGNKQYSAPVCSSLSPGTIDRRVLSVAVVNNCSSLSGSSTPVSVGEWVDMFLVEPMFDGRGNSPLSDSIYMEVIGPSSVGTNGGATGSQSVRRDVPYLVE
jgi:Flp pilus assembly protein TadG